jgi:hypothetical protein
LAKSERFAINLSNIVNLILFVTKVVASAESASMAVIASTLDSLLDLLSGFILECHEKAQQVQLSDWEEAHAASGKDLVHQTKLLWFL